MINVQSLSRAYGDFLAVDDVSFNIPPGEIVGLLGHNGAGKTTIMKMLSGYLEPSSGSVNIDGLDLESEPRAVQQRLGYLPENLPVYPDMSVVDYLDYAATLKGLLGDERNAQIRRAVRDTELQDRLLDPIATLSRGFKQRVGVAQAILGNPRLLILDEPTNGLDPNQTQHMRELIQALAASATIILSTHIMQEVDAICDRALILRNGRLALNEKLADLRSAGHMRLKTSLSTEALQSALSGIQGIGQLSPVQIDFDKHSYRVELEPGTDADETAAAIAGGLSTAGARLYQISSEVRDLETVFRDVNTAGESADAA